jgi:Zn-dependent M16 (insulinase) family peptidase
MTFNYLHPLIREKGGAYGGGCSVSENGLINLYSYRDPKIEQTYESFEKAIDSVLD